MTLQIDTHEDDQRQLHMTVTVPEERVQKEMRKYVRKLSKKINIPGFRKGKAPYHMLIRYFGAESVRSDTVNEMLDPIFSEALKQSEIEPHGKMVLEKYEHNPFTMNVLIPLEPKIVLGDYRALRQEPTAVEISDEALEEALATMQKEQAVTEPVDRPIEMGDAIVISGTAQHQGEEELFFNEERLELTLEEGMIIEGAGVAAALVGMEIGDEKAFTVTIAADEEGDKEDVDSAKEGSIDFNITLLDAQQEKLPELNDEFAKSASSFESLDELKEDVLQSLTNDAEKQVKNDVMDSMLKSLLDDAEEMSYSPLLVEMELDSMIERFEGQIRQAGIQDVDKYFEQSGQTRAQLRDDWEERSVESVERGLIFQTFIKTEKLSISMPEIEAAIDKRVDVIGDNAELQENMRKFYLESGREYIVNDLIQDKMYERIAAIYAGDAPDLTEEVEEAEADEVEESTDSTEEATTPESEEDTASAETENGED